MLRMRLTRTGAKKRPSYRVVVADSRAPRDGRHVEILGYYDPMTKPTTININTDRAVKWLRNGAQPTDRVRILLRHSGVLKAWEEKRLEDKRAHKEGEPARQEAAAARLAHAAERRARRVARLASASADAVASVASTAADAATPVAKAAARAARTATRAVSGAVESVAEATGLASDDKPKRGARRSK